MKEYILKEIKTNNIIIKYEKEEDKIIVEYAGFKEKDIFMYSKQQEIEIINVIEKQIKNDKIIKNTLKSNLKNTILWTIIFCVLSVLNIAFLSKTINNIIVWLSLVFTSSITTISLHDIKKEIKNIKEYKKTKENIQYKKDSLEKNITPEKISENYPNINYDNNINNTNINKKNKIKKLILKK